MTDINSQIEQARAAAGASAAQAAPAPGQAVAPAANPAGQAVAPAPAAGPITLDDFSTGAMSVDDYLKVKEHGLLVGGNDGLVKNARVHIDMSEVQPHLAIKANTGEGARYWKTYDGAVTTDGLPWAQAIQQANQMDTSGKQIQPYKSADIPMTVVEDVKDLEGNVVAEAGTRLGYSLSTTNKKQFDDMLRAIDKLDGATRADAVVDVTISSMKRSNKSYTWGVVQFELNGLVTDN